jgi:alanine dehydrogenase
VFPEFKEYLSNKDHLMRVLVLSKQDLLEMNLEKNTSEIVDEVKKALVERVVEKNFDDKVVISPSREEMFAICQTDEITRQKYEQIDLDHKLGSLMSVSAKNAGVKIVGANNLNKEKGFPRSESLIILYTNDTFRPLCILRGTDISAFRTGAYSSIVGEYLMPKKTGNLVACIGAGKIIEASLLCLDSTLNERISEILVYSPSPASLEKFVVRMQEKIGIKILGVSSVAEAVSNADYVITATNALNPVVDDPLLKEKSTVLLLGGDEIGTQFLYRCYHRGLLVCDDWELVKHRNCQSLPYFFNQDKQLKEKKIIELWQLITGKISPTNYASVCVNCVGVPALDIKVASKMYNMAIQTGVGNDIEL